MKYYSANMNDESKQWATELGIAAGWVDDNVFKIGCEICEFECGGLVTPAIVIIYGGSAAARVENQVWDRFRHDAEVCQCRHLARYDFCKSNPDKREYVSGLFPLR